MAELQARMSSHEFTEWMAYYTLEPWGWEADNFHFALVASVIANSNRNPKKKPRPFTLQDFMPELDSAKPALTPEQLRAKIDAAMIAFGGRMPRD